MLTYEEALEIVLRHSSRFPHELVPICHCLGRVLASDVQAPIDLPPFDNSSVDGYAVGSLDGTQFTIVGELAAGSAEEVALLKGTACRVFTGSRLPSGTLAVLMQESIIEENGKIVLNEAIIADSYIRRQGEELRAGDVVIRQGTWITPPVLGMLATLGLSAIDCSKLPEVSVVGTGSELVSPGEALRLGQVYESNTYGVQAAVRALRIEAVSICRVADDLQETKAVFGRLLRTSDVLLVCGGMSVGDHDYARPALEAIGVRELIWRVKIKPGKPFYFGIAPAGQLVFGLPGNPVSALVTFTLFVKPAISKMIGRDLGTWVSVRAGELLRGSKDRDEFARAQVRDNAVYLCRGQGSHMLSGLAMADTLVRIPADATIQPGEPAEVIHLNWHG
ncbi:MAG: gephyrin-like molybdotransferase Glp [Fimbriimonas sp.]